MSDKLTGYIWAFTQRFFGSVGAIWMLTTLIGPQIDGEYIVLAGAALAMASLLFVKPGHGIPEQL